MAIFRKLLKMESSIVISLNAETQEEADKTFEEYLSNQDRLRSFGEILADNAELSLVDLHTFPNEDAYNRACDRSIDVDITCKKG